ncbi:alpha/beta fold hydrolase [Mycolicibacterium pulveris]|uniref:Alpha/beta hydrolase n=1 Tax=Mycolicibacterium pulveris TaxID=36813 RepID=A0A7I7UUN7_MYCPV|nr:alpha/beta fold hydrolase [Mycolicibacterium pulveris]MCV6982565.1 alpha/beta fold hydrolase [Mycolicibacterium pulveris]BBY83776.1 alpha/beta hydrolase [Mycolicibacterium pulveris]
MTSRITFESDGQTCVGYFYGDHAEERPCVVMCQGFGGTQDTPAFTANAEGFAAAGYRVLTLDYRNFGESSGEPRQLVDIDGQLEDIAAAVEYARGVPGVDPDRIVLWGTSLGGAHVVVAASRDPRIAAVIAQIPFNGTARKVEGRSTAATLRLLWAMTVDAARGLLGLSPAYIKAVGGPGELAAMSSAEAQQTVAGMTSDTWRNEVAPRALFGLMRYRPADAAPRLRVPALVCAAERDKEIPLELVAQLADALPHGVLRTYPCPHFAFYRDDVREQVLADQLAFLDRVFDN